MIREATHITMAIFQLKTGVPHCNGYGNLNHGEEFKACEVSALQLFILATWLLQWLDIMFEVGIFTSHPSYLYAPASVRRKLIAHVIARPKGT